MTWARGALLVAALGALALGGWWLTRVDEGSGSPAPGGEGPQAFVRSEPDELTSLDAGVGRVSGQVRREDGSVVVGAQVLVFAGPPPTEVLECGICHEGVLDCAAPQTVAQVLEGLRAGHLRRGAPTHRTTTDARGAFVIDLAPLRRELLVLTPEGTARAETDAAPLALLLDEPAPSASRVVSVRDLHGAPVAGARVTVLFERTGGLAEYGTDAEGRLSLPSPPGEAWLAAEAAGYLPTAGRGRTELVLAPPLTLIVKTLLAGQPVDADVELDAHLAVPRLRTRGGVLRLEGLAPRLVSVRASTPELVAAEKLVELSAVETEVTFELLKGAKVFVTVMSDTGAPLDEVSGGLSGVANAVTVGGSVEQGAPLVLGPVPEGEYELSVSSVGRVTATRTVDLRPGETSLEVRLRATNVVTGRVVDALGAAVENAHVELLDEQLDLAGVFTQRDGTFEVEVDQPGTFTLIATHAAGGVAERTVTVNGPAVTLTLQPRGVIEAEVFELDGQPIDAALVVRSAERVVGVLEPVPGSHVARRAGLGPGRYVVTLSLPERLPVRWELDLREGETARRRVQLEAGHSVSGRVVGPTGSPVEQVSLFASDHDGMAATDAEGRFELKGLAAGPLELYGIGSRGAMTDTVKVTAPARDVVLTLQGARRVKGRVVDERGAPLAGVDVNDEQVTGPDGRFEVQVAGGSLTLFLSGYVLETLEPPADDVGDVVLRRPPQIEGEVVDAEGRPVPGALVRSTNDGVATATDAAGRFKLELTEGVECELVASRGGQFGRATARVGARVRVQLARGTRVFGRVVKAGGGGLVTTVSVAEPSAPSAMQELETDGEGRFEVSLPAGVWTFTPRTDRVSRAFDVRGERLELVLGDEASSCGLHVTAPEPIFAFSLVPAASAGAPSDEVVGGSLDFSGRRPERSVSARAVPCGDYVAVALLRVGLVRQPVSVREKAQPLALDLSRLVVDDAPE